MFLAGNLSITIINLVEASQNMLWTAVEISKNGSCKKSMVYVRPISKWWTMC